MKTPTMQCCDARHRSIGVFLAVLVLLAGPLLAAEADGRSAEDLAVEEYLLNAEIVKVEDLDTGITKPQRLTLRLGDDQRRAIYKDIDTQIDPTQTVHSDRVEIGFSDCYRYEVAAYRVDRLLGINLIPPTVLREVNGVPGSVQLWIESATTWAAALQANDDVKDFDLLLKRLTMTYMLDTLIYNIDRNNDNILVDRGCNRFYLIDHSRAFRRSHKLQPIREGAEIILEDGFSERLQAADLTKLQSMLGSLLSKQQIKCLDKRRKLLVKELKKRGLIS